MFNIGGGEFLVIAVIALLVLGPQRLPEAARTAGKVMGDLRRLSSGFQQELKTAFDDAETTKTTTSRRDPLKQGDAAAPGADAVSSAVGAVSGQAAPSRGSTRRTTPIKAAPAATRAKKAPAKAVTKRAPAKAAGGTKAAPAGARSQAKPASGTTAKTAKATKSAKAVPNGARPRTKGS